MNDPRRISSRHNPRFKELRALVDDPRRHGRALLDGIHLVGACLAHGADVKQLLVSDSGAANSDVTPLLLAAAGIERLQLSDGLFRELSGVGSPAGIAAVIGIPAAPEGLLAGDVVLLDAVQDAGNVGAILRTAAAAGVRNVLLGGGCAGAWTPRVLRAGQGAHFALAIREQVDLVEALARCPATSIATVAAGGTSLYEIDLGGPVSWLVGNEGAGLAPELVAAARVRATIPLAAGTESLNVAAATAVCLFEASRQRRGSVPCMPGPALRAPAK